MERRRTEFLAAGGFRVLRFWNHDVLTSTDAVLEEIRKAVSVEVKPPCTLTLSREAGRSEHLGPIQYKVELSLLPAPFSRFDRNRGLKR